MKKRLIVVMILAIAMIVPAVAGAADRDNRPAGIGGYPVPVTIHWEALDDPDIRGYALYYGETYPPDVLVQSGPRTYCDMTLYAGKTYYFAVASIDRNGVADPISDVLEWYAVPSATEGIYIERKVRKLWLSY